MAFGDGYRREERKPLASEGWHTVTLGVPSFKSKGQLNWLNFPITYGAGEDLQPDCFALFDCQHKDNQKEMSDFNKRATEIFDCFNITPSFDARDFPQWKGKTGKVFIAKNKEGFLYVKLFEKSQAAIDRQALQSELC